MIKHHRLIPEGQHYLTITEVTEWYNFKHERIISLKFTDSENRFTLVNFDLNDDMYSIRRARALLHALKKQFDVVTPTLLNSLVGEVVHCEIYHKPYTPNPEIKVARVKFI